jgi:hypothetical protein
MTPTTFLTSTFFKNVKEFATESVDLDIYKGKRQTGAYVRRRAEGQNVAKRGIETNSFTPPYLKPKITVTPGDLRKRAAGENLFADGGLAVNAQQYIASQIDRLDKDIIVRNIEIQAMQALYEGKITARDENGNVIATVDFGRDSSLFYTLATKWDSTADKLDDALTAQLLVQEKSGFVADFALLGRDALKYWRADQNIQRSVSKDWSSRGELAWDLRAQGGIWLGVVDGMDYWTYNEFYSNLANNGIQEALIPSKYVLFASTQAETSQSYGALELIDQNMGARAIDMYTNDDPKGTTVQVHSAPALITHHPNAYAVVKVLA